MILIPQCRPCLSLVHAWAISARLPSVRISFLYPLLEVLQQKLCMGGLENLKFLASLSSVLPVVSIRSLRWPFLRQPAWTSIRPGRSGGFVLPWAEVLVYSRAFLKMWDDVYTLFMDYTLQGDHRFSLPALHVALVSSDENFCSGDISVLQNMCLVRRGPDVCRALDCYCKLKPVSL